MNQDEINRHLVDKLGEVHERVDEVAAGATIECGLWGQISGAVSADFWNVSIRWELIKR